MVVAAQSVGAARDLRTAEVTHRLSEAHREAGGTGPRIAIRRVWIGGPH